MIVRRELPADAEAVRALFSNVSSASFFERLHADEAWLPALSFVALGEDGDVCRARGGHTGPDGIRAGVGSRAAQR